VPKLRFFQTPNGNSPVLDYIDALPERAAAVVLEELLALEEEYPVDPRNTSLSIKHLSGKIWELRIASPTTKTQHRVLYAAVRQELLVLSAFTKKTQKTPDRELRLARQRLQAATAGQPKGGAS
jgi:phage-related protein